MKRLVVMLALGLLLATGQASANGGRVPAKQSPPAVGEPRAEYEAVGLAHWYGPAFTGGTMANGKPLDQSAHTIATWLLPLGTRATVESACGSVEVEVTDRMPRPPGGQVIMDATNAVADKIMCNGYGFSRSGQAYGTERVTLTVSEPVNHDVNGDGQVDVVDAQEVLAHWGEVEPVKLAYEGVLEPYMAQDLGSAWGHNFYFAPNSSLGRQMLKINYPSLTIWTDPYDPVNPVTYTGNRTMAYISDVAKNHRDLWWIIGEEPNQWYPDCPNAKFDGEICPGAFGEYPSPEVYAHWYHDVVAAIKAGWGIYSHGKIIGFYFMQDDLSVTSGCGNYGHGAATSEYLDRFKAEWDRQGWGDVPMDAVDYNYQPGCSVSGPEVVGSITKSVAYWTTKQAEMQARPWLADKSMWIETTWGNPDGGACDSARRLVDVMNWAQGQRMEGLLWFSTVYEPGRYYPFQDSALYSTLAQGQLSVVGQAFRDGVVPPECQ